MGTNQCGISIDLRDEHLTIRFVPREVKINIVSYLEYSLKLTQGQVNKLQQAAKNDCSVSIRVRSPIYQRTKDVARRVTNTKHRKAVR